MPPRRRAAPRPASRRRVPGLRRPHGPPSQECACRYASFAYLRFWPRLRLSPVAAPLLGASSGARASALPGHENHGRTAWIPAWSAVARFGREGTAPAGRMEIGRWRELRDAAAEVAPVVVGGSPSAWTDPER